MYLRGSRGAEKMRCMFCEEQLRLARVERCEEEQVEICTGCNKIFLGHPIDVLVSFPTKTDLHQNVFSEKEDEWIN